jgi:hypothetical protein
LTIQNDPSVGAVAEPGAPAPTAGEWGGILAFDSGSLEIEYTSLSYSEGIRTGNGTVTVAHSTIAHTGGRDSEGAIGFNSVPGTPAQSAVANQIADSGISVVEDGGRPPTISDNVFAAGAYGIGIQGFEIDPSSIIGNSGSGGIGLDGTLGANFAPAANAMQWQAGRLDIPTGITMTLPAGLVFKLQGSYLTVEGTLNSDGTEDDPAIITASTDDAVGYPVGDGTTPVAGDAGHIQSIPVDGAPQPVIDLSYTDVRYSYGIYVWGDVALSMLHDSVTDTLSQEAVFDEESGASTVDIEDCTIDAVTKLPGWSETATGISIDEPNSSGTAPIVENNEVDYVQGEAVSVRSNHLIGADLLGNTGSGDETTAIGVGGTLVGDLALPTPGLPWGAGGLTIAPSTTLSLNPGAVMKFYGYSIDVEGSLIANGTAGNPVIMTSANDQSVAPDASADSTPPAPGDWMSIQSTAILGQQAPTIDLNHVVSRYGTGVTTSGAADLTVTNSQFIDDADESQIDTESEAPSPTDIENDTVGRIAVFANPNDSPAPSATTPITTVASNTVTGGQIAITGNDLLPSHYTGNSSTNPSVSELSLDGALGENATVPTTGLPWAIRNLGVPAGITLTIPAGAALKADFGGELWVEGALISTATAAAPAAFAGISDPSVGGATNTDEGSWPDGTQWYGIGTAPTDGQPAPTIDLPNVEILDASKALVDSSGDATVSGTIKDDDVGIVGPPAAADGSCPNGTVTATNVDWGTPSGPAPYGSGPGVSGCVVVKPWVGE